MLEHDPEQNSPEENPQPARRLIIPCAPRLPDGSENFEDDAVKYTFRAHVENVFTSLGCADVGIVSYATDVCTEFIRMDNACVRTPSGQEVWSLEGLIALADNRSHSNRESYNANKIVGDVVLFFTGFYRDGLEKLSGRTPTRFLNFREIASRHYERAARASRDLEFELWCTTDETEPDIVSPDIFKRVASDFDYIAYCLGETSRAFQAA